MIPEQYVWNEGSIGWAAGSKIEVEKPVVIDIAEVRPHGHKDSCQPCFFSNIPERSLARVLVDFESVCLHGQLQVAARHINQRVRITCDEEIHRAVVVVIKEPDWEAPNR